MRRQDEAIRKDVETHLRWDARLDASAVSVAVRNGIVTLAGEVSSYFERSAAIEGAWAVADVADVVNELLVRLPVNSAPDDEELLSRINLLLEWNPQVEEDDIEALLRDGAVTLEGTVDAHWKRRYVGDLVGSLEGVVAIHNNLVVVPSGTVHDQMIAEEVMAALRRSALVNVDEIEVRVDRGEVTLSGRISSWPEADAAEEAASATPGVVAVYNRLVFDRAA